MPRRPDRVASADRRRQILAVATELFARRGFRGTTTRQIAQRAGMNEAILFRHFPRKDDLIWAILDGKCRSAGGREHLEEELHRPVSEAEIFAGIAEGILRRNIEDTTLTRLFLFSALNRHRLTDRLFRVHVAGYYQTLARHIRRGIREGRFRQVDALLAARGFLGMVVYHFLIQELFGGRRYQKFDVRRVSRTLAEIWLGGMRVPQKVARRLPKPAVRRDFSARRASIREGK